MASSITVYDKGVDSNETVWVKFKITLSSNFNSDNYVEVGVCNFPFTDGTGGSTNFNLVGPSTGYWKNSTSNFNNSTTVYHTIYEYMYYSLSPGTSYVFYGYAKAKNGKYYNIGTGDAVTVTTASAQQSGIPTNLSCHSYIQYDSSISSEFSISMNVPSNTKRLNIQIARNSSFTSGLFDINGDINDFNNRNNKYYYYFTDANPGETYYIRARINTSSSSTTWGNWCNTLMITVPPSNSIFNTKSDGSYRYLSFSVDNENCLRLYIRSSFFEKNDYSYDYISFSIKKNGAYISSGYKFIGSNRTNYNGTIALKIYRTDNSTGKACGIGIQNPTEGVYEGEIRLYRHTDYSSDLQPVDEDGNTVYGILNFEVESQKIRPDHFDWTYSKTSGGPYNLKAEEWNRLTTNINDVRDYKGLTSLTFTNATANYTEVTADIFMEVINAINNLGGNINSSGVERNRTLYASLLNSIRDGINGIN